MSINNESEIAKINTLSLEEMARAIRFHPVGHRYFVDKELNSAFMMRFNQLGGWTPALSKQIGWTS